MPVLASSPHGSADNKPNLGGEQENWTINRETIVRHHRAPRTKFYVPDENTFPIPVKYVDVIRWTETDFDEIALNHINDLWVDAR